MLIIVGFICTMRTRSIRDTHLWQGGGRQVVAIYSQWSWGQHAGRSERDRHWSVLWCFSCGALDLTTRSQEWRERTSDQGRSRAGRQTDGQSRARGKDRPPDTNEKQSAKWSFSNYSHGSVDIRVAFCPSTCTAYKKWDVWYKRSGECSMEGSTKASEVCWTFINIVYVCIGNIAMDDLFLQ